MGSSQFITRALLCLVCISLNANLKVYGSTDSPLADVGPGIGEYEGVTSNQDLSAVYSLENGPTLLPIVEKVPPTPQDFEEEITEEATTMSKDGETVKADTSSNTTVFIIIALFLLTNIIKGIPVIIGEVLMRRAQKTVDDDYASGTEQRLENAESSNSIPDTGIQMTVSYCNGKSMDSSINEIFIRGRESISPEFSSGKETEEEILEDNPAYVEDSDEINNFSSVNKDEENHVNGNKKSL